MTKNMVKPRNILMTFRDHNEESLTTIKQIYNARQTLSTSSGKTILKLFYYHDLFLF